MIRSRPATLGRALGRMRPLWCGLAPCTIHPGALAVQWGDPAPHRRHQHHRRPTTPRPTTSPTAADPQDPLINDLAGAPAWAGAEICISESICHIDSDIQIFQLDLARTRRATN